MGTHEASLAEAEAEGGDAHPPAEAEGGDAHPPAEAEGGGAHLPPRSSLFSDNMLHRVEGRSAALFELGLESMTPYHVLDCCVLYIRGDTAETRGISDLPFPLPDTISFEQAL